MIKQDYIVVTDSQTHSDPIPSLHALEVYTAPRENKDGEESFFREASSSENSYVMLPSEVIPFENYIDIQADFLYLASFEVRDNLLEMEGRVEYINYVVDVSGPSKASREKLLYSTKTPQDIRAATYGYISFDDFENLFMKKDFSYGALLEIDDYETLEMKDLRFLLRCLPRLILKISVDDEKLNLLLKLPDFEFRPTPKKILELISYCYKRCSMVLGMLNMESFRLVLLDLNEESKKQELIGA